MLNTLSTAQIHAITLWYLLQHSLSSFYKISQHYADLAHAIDGSQTETWRKLGIHKNHIQRLQDFQSSESQLHFQRSLEQIQLHSDFVLLHTDAEYPQQLSHYAHKPQIAIVGSRKPSLHGRQVAYDFAFYLSEQGFYINSGLAQGIDEAAHQAALQHRRTIAVMGTGIEQTYPAAHQTLRQQIIEHGGTVITEFLPFTPPLQQHFPRRNRIVSGLSLGVIVAEAALKSGSLLTAQWAAEQGKTTFAIPGHIYSEHHQGCHQLIREGAILIEHPQQVIEDLALATQWQSNANHLKKDSPPEQASTIPPHLIHLYNQLDWVGQTLDQLSLQLQQEVSALTSQLMELELLGFCTQQAGLYLRCRILK